MSGSIYIVVCTDKLFSAGSNFEVFCFSEDGLQKINITAFYRDLLSHDIVFLDLSVADLSSLSYNSCFLRLLKTLLFSLGTGGFLNNVYLERQKDCLDLDGISLISFFEYLKDMSGKSFCFSDDGFLPLIGLIHLLSLDDTSGNGISLKDNFLEVTNDDVSAFYKDLVIRLVDEKISKDKITGFGLSQSLIVSRLNDLLDTHYKESDLSRVSILHSLSEKLNQKELNIKVRAALVFMLRSKFPYTFLDEKIGPDDIQQLFSTDYILDAQKELRSLFVMSSFKFWAPDKTDISLCPKYQKSHLLDICFSFLDEHHELLGHEDKITDFFYNALNYLNVDKKLKIVQVGAFDGIHGDFIHDFLMREKCSALLIEPQSDAFEKLRENCLSSKSDIKFLNKAIGPESGFIKMYRVKNDFLDYYNRDDITYLGRIASFDRSYVVENIASKILRWGDGRVSAADAPNFVEVIDVEVVSFESIIDFKLIEDNELVLQIDCEGFDFEVIKCFPLSTKRPALIHFESDKLGDSKLDCFRHLISQGYLLIEHGPKISSDTLALDLKNRALLRSLQISDILFQE